MTAQLRRSPTGGAHGAAAQAPTSAAAPTLTPNAGTKPAGTTPAGTTAAGTNDTAGARRIAAAFARAAVRGRAALIPYVVAGYPDHATSLAAALAAADAGADLLEIGLPYSDPLADGATLQRATTAALRAGATLDGSVSLLREIREARPDLPLVPMCYANQIHVGGDGHPGAGGPPPPVATRLAEAGASGVIVADLTPDEGLRFEAVARDVGIAVVYLIAPTTTAARRAQVARRSGGFLYCVSLVGVTGARSALPPSVRALVAAARADSPVPVAVGFGVSLPAHVRLLVGAGADGVIVASALVDALGPDGRDVAALAALVSELRAATIRLKGDGSTAGTTRRPSRDPGW
jgi:tryptophan synthase alpha chain